MLLFLIERIVTKSILLHRSLQKQRLPILDMHSFRLLFRQRSIQKTWLIYYQLSVIIETRAAFG